MLELRVASSRILTWVLISAHTVAGMLFGLTDLHGGWKIAVLPLFLASLVFSLRRQAWRVSPSSLVGLQLNDEGKFLFSRRDGQDIEGVLLGSSFISPWLTILNLRPEEQWQTVSLVILPDAVKQEDFRRLRVLLRWKYAHKLG